MVVLTNPDNDNEQTWETAYQTTTTAAFEGGNFEFSFPLSAVQFDGVAQNSQGLPADFSFDIETGITLNQNEDGFNYGDADESGSVDIVD